MVNDKPVAGWSKKLLERLGDYEDESRLLVKLADTGRVIQLLEHGIDTTLHILHQYNSETRREWIEHLQKEREIRVEKYEKLLSEDEEFVKEMGDADQQVHILTLMKHDFNRFGAALTSRELNVISSIFDRLVEQSNTVIGELPNWFATTTPDNAQKAYMEGEEVCLRQAAILASLNHHPNVQTFYGACHVGKPFVLHEFGQLRRPTWSFFLDCTLGLQYVHQRGYVYKDLTDRLFSYSADGKRGVVSGLGLEKIQNKCERTDSERMLFDVRAWRRTIFAIMAKDRDIAEFESDENLPIVKPDFLSDEEWILLQDLWHKKPDFLHDIEWKLLQDLWCLKPDFLSDLEWNRLQDLWSTQPHFLSSTEWNLSQYIWTAKPYFLNENYWNRLQELWYAKPNFICDKQWNLLLDLWNVKPNFLSDNKWNLLQDLYFLKFSIGRKKVLESMSNVAMRMKQHVKWVKEREDMDDHLNIDLMYGLCESVEPNAESLVTGIKTHVVSDGNTIMNVLDKVDKLLSTTSVTTSEYHGVYIRVRDLMNQFDEYQEPLPAKLVASYSSIVWRLYQTLGDMVEDECSCSIQPSVMRANLINGFNLDIDEIMGSGVGILRASELHSWRSFLWKSHKHCDLTLKTDAIHLNWLDNVPRDHSTLYIPRTHIQRTHWIGKGAFGSVYYAKWLGTNVVMKQIETNQAEKDNQNKFFQETELWLTLNHKHLVHLYGVDDSEQRPFFICERATCGTLTRFLSKIGYSGLEDHLTDTVFGLGSAQEVIFPGRLESEIGDSRLRECLIDAALGLENLHESGIAHGDLKGDNILVCLVGFLKTFGEGRRFFCDQETKAH